VEGREKRGGRGGGKKERDLPAYVLPPYYPSQGKECYSVSKKGERGKEKKGSPSTPTFWGPWASVLSTFLPSRQEEEIKRGEEGGGGKKKRTGSRGLYSCRLYKTFPILFYIESGLKKKMEKTPGRCVSTTRLDWTRELVLAQGKKRKKKGGERGALLPRWRRVPTLCVSERDCWPLAFGTRRAGRRRKKEGKSFSASLHFSCLPCTAEAEREGGRKKGSPSLILLFWREEGCRASRDPCPLCPGRCSSCCAPSRKKKKGGRRKRKGHLLTLYDRDRYPGKEKRNPGLPKACPPVLALKGTDTYLHGRVGRRTVEKKRKEENQVLFTYTFIRCLTCKQR